MFPNEKTSDPDINSGPVELVPPVFVDWSYLLVHRQTGTLWSIWCPVWSTLPRQPAGNEDVNIDISLEEITHSGGT